MNLKDIYDGIEKIIDRVDFSLLWEGFTPLRFAVYNQDECFFDGKIIPKTDEFIGNTAILYEGEYIGIWNVIEEMDLEILASKMIHEMFHGYQMKNRESRHPNELEALMKYDYSVENLSVKMEENRLLADLVENFDEGDFKKFLSLRKYRLLNHEYEYRYESAVEQIEGSAEYVELNALKQISEEKYRLKKAGMLGKITDPKNCFPIRIISYSIGGLIFELLKKSHLHSFHEFSDEPVTTGMIKSAEAYAGEVPFSSDIEALIDGYHSETQRIIQQAVAAKDLVLEGEYELLGVNVYNARYYKGYMVSTYFVMFMRDSSQEVLYGDFVIQLNDEKNIEKVYRIK